MRGGSDLTKAILKVIGKERNYDDVSEALVYKIKMKFQQGKKDDINYEKTQLVVEGANIKTLYESLEAGDDIRLEWAPAIPKKINQYSEDPK